MTTRPDLPVIRHSASHVLAQAVLKLFPDAKLGIGPAIDEGFYYDFELPRPLSGDDLTQLEDLMKAIIKESQTFRYFTVPRNEAEKLMAQKNQPYKLEIIRDLDLPEYSFYENGPFVDLCRGPHVKNTAEIGTVKLLKISGAYWRGSEKNKMLQRIYGTAFHTDKELKEYLNRLEEAQKRDHRVLGKELDLFSISEDIGGGLVLWHPKGALVRYLIEEFWRKQHFAAGYELLYTPHIGKSDLWNTSGHLGFYKDSMFANMEIDEQDYYVKPMNCPFHIMVYKNTPKSYRDLPLRFAELGTVYRYERSGVLHGLMRVRGFTQDDAHIFCTPEQVDEEIRRAVTFSLSMLKAFGFETFEIFLSTRPKEKSVGEQERWDQAENALRQTLDAIGMPYQVDEGGGAFYGPKIDIKIEDAIGRKWQCSTVQFDFNMSQRFDMTYTDKDGEKKQPYMIHRALLGSIERFFGVLIEHYAGKFPLWLAPVQVRILTITQGTQDYARNVLEQMKKAGLRAELDDSSEKIGYKIRQTASQKVPYMIIVGQKEADENKLSLRTGKEDLGVMAIADCIAKLTAEAAPPVL